MFFCREYGDAAVLVDVVAVNHEERWAATQRLGTALLDAVVPGLVDVVASYENVVAMFDPLVADAESIRRAVDTLTSHSARARAPVTFRIPVAYGGERGPDLEHVAAEQRMRPEALVAFHTAETWTVRFRGSPVGSPMLDGPRLGSPVPRMRVPRAQLAAGAVAVSGYQSMVYPAASPGGWRVIGQTPATLFDLGLTPPVPYYPGDLVHFFQIDHAAWDDWAGALTDAS